MTSAVRDDRWPALTRALDTSEVTAALDRAAGLASREAGTSGWSAKTLKHKPGKRCTVMYTLCSETATGFSDAPVRVIGKVYRRRRLAARMFTRIAELKRASLLDDQLTGIPAPLAFVQDIGLVLHQYVDAPDVRRAIAEDPIENASPAPIALCARWLAGLHDATPVPGLNVKPMDHEIAKADRWCEEIVSRLPEADGRRVRDTQHLLHSRARQMSGAAPAMIHRDFYYANVLWDGRRLWMLDFDQMSLGDPALDAGHFLAHVASLSLRTTGRPDAFASAAHGFLDSYLEARPSEMLSRVTWYKAYTFLKLAATEAVRRPDRLERLSAVFADLAFRALDAMPDGH